MKNFLFRRLLQFVVVVFGATLLTFAVTYIAPSDTAEMMFASKDIVPSPEMLEETREKMGLNKPFVVQYLDWLINLAQGNLGYSYSLKMPVADMLGGRLIQTVYLALTSIFILFTLSLILGVLAAVKKGSIIDHIINIFSAISISIPSFWLGLILIYCFVVKLHIFKITDLDSFGSVVLPAMTLALPLVGRYAKQIRGAVLDEINSNYVIGAKARGVKASRIIFKHVLPNTLFSIITLFGMTVASLLGGTAIVESIFSWPGLGTMALDAINYRDYTLLQAYVILMAFIYVSINLLVDILTQVIDPRIGMFESEVASE